MSQERKILIIEDDPAIMRGLRDNLSMSGYQVRCVVEGALALEAAASFAPDLILLDIMLPGMNGFEICQTIRGRGSEVPIIMLTAKSEEADIVRGLNLGANDYLVKPFRLRELMARIEVQFRAVSCEIKFSDFLWDSGTKVLSRNGKMVELTPKEIAVLDLLVMHPNRVYTRQQILDQVWGEHVIVTERSVDRCMASLRAKIEKDSRRPKHVKTLREIGYRFVI
ncbi:MAG: response regulator transcription factor [Verrucomicrobiota bacterium]